MECRAMDAGRDWYGFRQAPGGTRNEIVGGFGAGLDEATSACAAAIAERFGEGPVDGKIQAHIVVVQN